MDLCISENVMSFNKGKCENMGESFTRPKGNVKLFFILFLLKFVEGFHGLLNEHALSISNKLIAQ